MKRLTFAAFVLILCAVACGRGGNVPDAECRGAGRYEAGKGSPAVACCKGLKQVPVKSAAYEGDVPTPVCTDTLPMFVYACVEGSCGDGLCEAGESAPCSCPEDCPSAAFPAPAPSTK